MTRFRDRWMFLLLATAMIAALLSGLPPTRAHATTSVDQWVSSTTGQHIEWNNDGYLYQCVDLVQDYLDKVYGINSQAWGNAVNWANGRGTGGAQLANRQWAWSADQNTSTFRNGDILVWEQNYGAGTGAAGHIGIWYNGRVYDQNDARHRPADTANYSSWFSGGYLGRWTPPRVSHTSNGGAWIKGVGSDRCIDVNGGNSANGTAIQLYDCNGTAAQQWAYNSGVLRVFGDVNKCLDVTGGVPDNGTPLQLYDCNGTAAQQWQALADGSLKSDLSGRCLDARGGATDNGTRLQIFDCNGSNAQKWVGLPTPNGGDGIVNPNSGRCLDVPGGGISPLTQVQLYDCNRSGAQQLKRVGSTLRVYFDKCLEAKGGGTSSGTVVAIYWCNDTAAQNWTFHANGTVTSFSGLCLDATGGAQANGTGLQLVPCNGTGAQQWHWLTARSVSLANAKSATQVTLGASVTLSATLADAATKRVLGSAPVQLQRQSGKSWITVGGTATNSSGVASLRVKPATTTTYRWYAAARSTSAAYYGAAESAAVTVKVAVSGPTPTITGTAKVGHSLTAKSGTWVPSKVALAYQWYASGKAISGATKPTFALTASQYNTAITVKITGTKAGYATVTKTSAATAKVAAGTLTAPTPMISGTTKVGSMLTVKPGVWSPGKVTLKYQWYRGGTVIKGATKTTYKLATADRTKKIAVKVSGTEPGYATVTKVSAATKAVS